MMDPTTAHAGRRPPAACRAARWPPPSRRSRRLRSQMGPAAQILHHLKANVRVSLFTCTPLAFVSHRARRLTQVHPRSSRPHCAARGERLASQRHAVVGRRQRHRQHRPRLPLPPKYGKTRERSLCETKPTLRMPMAPDTLVCAKGFNMSTLTKLTMSESMCAVLPPYSPSAKIYAEKYEPARYTSGFVMSPVTQGGKWMESDVAADFKSTFRKRTFGSPSPSDMSPMSTMSKFTFDQKASLPHIPVASRKLVFN